jgi:superfamily I DNA/RNA helicase
MPWMVDKRLLGPEQMEVLDAINRDSGKSWIRGFAGSGKSVVLVHSLIESLIRNPKLNVCVVVFTHALKNMLSSGLPDNLKHIPVMTYFDFKNRNQHYDIVFVDEIQDLEPEILSLIAALSDRVIVAGDEEQSIYENRVSPVDIDRILSPRSFNLSFVYRLTERLRNIVSTILPGARIRAARMGRLTTEVNITLGNASNEFTEIEWVWKEALRRSRPGFPTAVLVPSQSRVMNFISAVCLMNKRAAPEFLLNRYNKPNYDLVNDELELGNLELRYLGGSYGDLDESETRRLVYILTYHSAKGLDFENVFLPYLSISQSIWRNDEMERRLFFVACTRCRVNLFITYSGLRPHKLVAGLPQNLLDKLSIDVTESSNGGNGDEFDGIF